MMKYHTAGIVPTTTNTAKASAEAAAVETRQRILSRGQPSRPPSPQSHPQPHASIYVSSIFSTSDLSSAPSFSPSPSLDSNRELATTLSSHLPLPAIPSKRKRNGVAPRASLTKKPIPSPVRIETAAPAVGKDVGTSSTSAMRGQDAAKGAPRPKMARKNGPDPRDQELGWDKLLAAMGVTVATSTAAPSRPDDAGTMAAAGGRHADLLNAAPCRTAATSTPRPKPKPKPTSTVPGESRIREDEMKQQDQIPTPSILAVQRQRGGKQKGAERDLRQTKGEARGKTPVADGGRDKGGMDDRKQKRKRENDVERREAGEGEQAGPSSQKMVERKVESVPEGAVTATDEAQEGGETASTSTTFIDTSSNDLVEPVEADGRSHGEDESKESKKSAASPKKRHKKADKPTAGKPKTAKKVKLDASSGEAESALPTKAGADDAETRSRPSASPSKPPFLRSSAFASAASAAIVSDSPLYTSHCLDCSLSSPRAHWSTFLCPHCSSTRRRADPLDVHSLLPPVRMEITYTGFRADLGGASYTLTEREGEGFNKRVWRTWGDGVTTSEFELAATKAGGGGEEGKVERAGVRLALASHAQSLWARTMLEELVDPHLPYTMLAKPRCHTLRFAPVLDDIDPFSAILPHPSPSPPLTEETMPSVLFDAIDHLNAMLGRSPFISPSGKVQNTFDAGTVVVGKGVKIVLNGAMLRKRTHIGVLAIGAGCGVSVQRLPHAPPRRLPRAKQKGRGKGKYDEGVREMAKRTEKEEGKMEEQSVTRQMDVPSEMVDTEEAANAAIEGEDTIVQQQTNIPESDNIYTTIGLPDDPLALFSAAQYNPSIGRSAPASPSKPPKRPPTLPTAVLALRLSSGDCLNLDETLWQRHQVTLSSKSFGVWLIVYSSDAPLSIEESASY